MITADDLVAANRAIRKLSAAEVASLWSTLDLEDVEATKVALLRVMPAIVFKYGDMAAAIAADLYDEWRSNVREGAKYRALMADIADVSKVEASTRYAIDGLFREPTDPAAVLALLQNDVAVRHSMNQGRETMLLNANQDPAKPRWARVAVGKSPCKYCLMLASRGFTKGLGYTSEESARRGAFRASKSHGATCKCLVVPEFATGKVMDDYDPDADYERWQAMEAAEAADKAAKAAT